MLTISACSALKGSRLSVRLEFRVSGGERLSVISFRDWMREKCSCSCRYEARDAGTGPPDVSEERESKGQKGKLCTVW